MSILFNATDHSYKSIDQEQNITWSQQVANNMCTFIANNIISLIIIVLIIIVLIYRYYDVQEKKKNKSSNTSDEESDVIE